MQSSYYHERVAETKKFRYESDEVMYHVFKDDYQNPHPDEFGARFDDDIFVSDKVPEPIRDIVAYHEWIEIQGIKEHNYPQNGTLEGNQILDKLHTKAIRKERELAASRNIMTIYEKWLQDYEKQFGARAQ